LGDIVPFCWINPTKIVLLGIFSSFEGDYVVIISGSEGPSCWRSICN
jgi:hypothetical protein